MLIGALRAAWMAVLIIPAIATAAPTDNFAEDFARLRDQDTKLQTIGWKLLIGNAGECINRQPATGFLLQDAAAYSNPSAIRAAQGLEGDFFVQSVVPNSPAAMAGIVAGMEVATIDGAMLTQVPQVADAPWQRLAIIDEKVSDSLAENGVVTLTLRAKADSAVLVASRSVCTSRFELISGSASASTDGMRIAVGREFAGFGYPEEEFAAALAHELAHNLLGHRQWLDRHGRKRKQTRVTEDEADRLMPWLLANAGYDPTAGVRFMERWGPKHGGGLFRKRTHAGWDERAEAIAAELPRIRESQSVNGTARWKIDFTRTTTAG